MTYFSEKIITKLYVYAVNIFVQMCYNLNNNVLLYIFIIFIKTQEDFL